MNICKNLQYNGKRNPIAHQEDYKPQPSGIYPRNARAIQYIKIKAM